MTTSINSLNNTDILFLFPHLPNPRMIKRINVARTIGLTKVVYWDRKTVINEGNKIPNEVEAFKIEAVANEGAPLKRLGSTIKVMVQSFKILKTLHPKCIHVSKTDMLLTAYLYKKLINRSCNIIYEVSDMHELMLNESKKIIRKTISGILINLEKIMLKKVSFLIITSEYFYKKFYYKLIEREKVLFIPNIPDVKIFEDYRKKSSEIFTVGYIGSVRYRKQLELLVDATEECNVNLLIAGNGKEYNYIKQYCSNKKNVEIFGAYEYEKDIKNLYERVNCIYSVYDTALLNVRIALPNRLYEATKCNIPLIVAKDTELSNIVDTYNIGVSITDTSKEELKQAISSLSKNREKYNVMCNNTKRFVDEYEKYNSSFELSKIYNLCVSGKKYDK